MQYKALSLLQPWASLVVMGAKQIETRSWNTKHRGLLLIHASKPFIKIGSPAHDVVSEAINTYNVPLTCLPQHFGAIIGCVNVVDTFQFSEDPLRQLQEYKGGENPWIPYRAEGNDFESDVEEDEWNNNIEREMAFGDYSPGRYGWHLENPVMFETPIPCKGSLGLWTPDEATARLVEQVLV